MPAEDYRLTTREMADFVVNGYLRFDGIVPGDINKRVIEELGILYAAKMRQIVQGFGGNPDKVAPVPVEEIVRPESLTPR